MQKIIKATSRPSALARSILMFRLGWPKTGKILRSQMPLTLLIWSWISFASLINVSRFGPRILTELADLRPWWWRGRMSKPSTALIIRKSREVSPAGSTVRLRPYGHIAPRFPPNGNQAPAAPTGVGCGWWRASAPAAAPPWTVPGQFLPQRATLGLPDDAPPGFGSLPLCRR
jgi:hypothetical protein